MRNTFAPRPQPPAATPASPPRLAGYETLLPPDRAPIVAIIAEGARRNDLLPWLRSFPHGRIHLLSGKARPEWDIPGLPVRHHAAAALPGWVGVLREVGPVNVIVDLSKATPAEHEATWRKLFLFLAEDGLYAVDRSTTGSNRFQSAMADWATRIITADESGTSSGVDREYQSLAMAVRGVLLERQMLLMTKQLHHYLKLRDGNVIKILRTREPDMRVVEFATRSAGTLVSKAEVTSHEAAVEIRCLPDRMPFPTLHLRHYEGRIAFAGNSLLYTRNTILPDSFRRHLAGNPTNPRAINSTPAFAQIPPDIQPDSVLPGSYYHVDPQWPGHFGHIMTETLGKLWGWDEAKRRIPELSVLFYTSRRDGGIPELERRLLRAYGLAEEDITWVDRPVYVESLVTATTMWHSAEPHYVHPDLVEVWDRIAATLVDRNAPCYDRIFVSRTEEPWRRQCRNIRDVEALFESHGFTIVYPEQHDLGVQAGMFASASVIAGFGGSAMFNVMYARKLQTMIVLSHEAYTARNEHLYTSLLGCRVHYFWSPPDVPQPEGGWSLPAFDSNWEFDFARNEKTLRDVLVSL